MVIDIDSKESRIAWAACEATGNGERFNSKLMEVGVEIYANGDLRKQEVAAQTSEVICPYFPARHEGISSCSIASGTGNYSESLAIDASHNTHSTRGQRKAFAVLGCDDREDGSADG